MHLNIAEIASNVELRPDGLWCARTSSAISYPEDGNEHCFAIEEGSFWFQHRNECLVQLLRAYPPDGTFFDIGGGNGHVAKAIQEAGWEVVLVEPGQAGAQNAKRRGIRNVVQATLQDARFRSASLPAVGLFDVVEHIQADRDFLREVHRLLCPNGKVFITVPAFQALWSYEDEQAGHWRRYTRSALSGALADSGFEVDFATYIFQFLPLPILGFRVMPYRLGFVPKQDSAERMRADHRQGGAMRGRILSYLRRRELVSIAKGRPCHFGGSCLMVAHKNS